MNFSFLHNETTKLGPGVRAAKDPGKKSRSELAASFRGIVHSKRGFTSTLDCRSMENRSVKILMSTNVVERAIMIISCEFRL